MRIWYEVKCFSLVDDNPIAHLPNIVLILFTYLPNIVLILFTCLPNIVLILLGEISPSSLLGVKGISGFYRYFLGRVPIPF